MPQFVLRATHQHSHETVVLELKDGQTWSVGRENGSHLPNRWNLTFDAALSREHFQLRVQGATVWIEADKNRHPIYYQGVAAEHFHLAPGQSFRTAHTQFELDKAPPVDGKPGSITWDLLTFTGMTAVLLKGGFSFGKIFQMLHVHHSGEAREFIRDLEHSVLHRGQPFSVALAQHPEIFSEHYVASVELGEMTDLPKTMERLFRQLTRDFPPLFQGPSDQRLELSSACRNIGELLEGGAIPQKAVEIASKVCRQDQVKAALLELLEQLRSGTPLADCLYPSLFTDFFPGLIATHDRVGTLPRAFLDLADILSSRGTSGEG